MRAAGLKRGVVIVENPQTGEILAMVSLPTYDDNAFARGISATRPTRSSLTDPNKPLLNHAVQAHYPPGSTYKLVTGTGRADRPQDLADDARRDAGLPARSARRSSGSGTTAAGGRSRSTDGFAHSSDTFFFQLAGMLGIDRLAYWATSSASAQPTGIDLPGEVSGIVPSNAWKQATFGEDIFPGEVLPGRDRAGLRRRHADPADQRLLGARERRQAVPAADRPGDRRPGRLRGPPLQAEADPPLDVPRSTLKTMRLAARNVLLVRHTYNLVDLPIVVAGKSGTAEFGLRDSKGRLPFHSWFVAFVPKHPAKTASRSGRVEGHRRARTPASSCSRSPTIPGRRATRRRRS